MPHIFRVVLIASVAACFMAGVAAGQYGPAQPVGVQTGVIQYPQTQYPQNQYPQTQYPQAQLPRDVESLQAPPWQTRPGTAHVAQIAPCEIEQCEDSQIVARVGGEVVLASEVISLFVRDFIEKLDKPITHEQRKDLIRARLKYHTELKLIYIDAKRSLPEEAMPKIKESIAKHFDEKEIKSMMKATKTDSRQALDDKLHELGTSIERQKLIFVERALAMQWMQQQATAGKTITHEMLLEYYNEHLSDYDHEAKARWEELAVKVSGPSAKQEAFARIAKMGNMVQDGVAFSEVAKKESDGITSHKGGVRDWTTKGSLVSSEIDNAIFSLPVGALSRIIETKRGFHIVRVIERDDAYRTPFLEVQNKIRKQIKDQQEMQARKEYLTKLAGQTKVWTIFDKPDSGQLQADLRGGSGGRGR